MVAEKKKNAHKWYKDKSAYAGIGLEVGSCGAYMQFGYKMDGFGEEEEIWTKKLYDQSQVLFSYVHHSK